MGGQLNPEGTPCVQVQGGCGLMDLAHMWWLKVMQEKELASQLVPGPGANHSLRTALHYTGEFWANWEWRRI
eukprot:4489697-Karenia_brevis.AAC.1